MTSQEYQFMQHKRQLITGLRYFCISLNSTWFKIKILIRNIMFYEDKTIDRTSYSYWSPATCELAFSDGSDGRSCEAILMSGSAKKLFEPR